MSSALIGILGSTGHLGTRVARLLQDNNAPHVLYARDPESAHVPRGAGTLEARAVDYSSTAQLTEAFTGVGTLFMVSAHEAPGRLQEHANIVDAATAAGVGHIVYTSFLGASPEATFTFARDHHATEEMLRAAAAAGGPTFTALRDSFYLEALIAFVGPDGVLRGPAGQGRVSAVSQADVAAVAARLLLDPRGHEGAVLDVTGREALTLTEVASLIEEETGRPTRFENESVKEAYASREVYQAQQWQLDAWVSTYTAIAAGEVATVSDTVKAITGRDPLTLRDVLRR